MRSIDEIVKEMMSTRLPKAYLKILHRYGIGKLNVLERSVSEGYPLTEHHQSINLLWYIRKRDGAYDHKHGWALDDKDPREIKCEELRNEICNQLIETGRNLKRKVEREAYKRFVGHYINRLNSETAKRLPIEQLKDYLLECPTAFTVSAFYNKIPKEKAKELAYMTIKLGEQDIEDTEDPDGRGGGVTQTALELLYLAKRIHKQIKSQDLKKRINQFQKYIEGYGMPYHSGLYGGTSNVKKFEESYCRHLKENFNLASCCERLGRD